jgi:hypothetical protein
VLVLQFLLSIKKIEPWDWSDSLIPSTNFYALQKFIFIATNYFMQRESGSLQFGADELQPGSIRRVKIGVR